MCCCHYFCHFAFMFMMCTSCASLSHTHTLPLFLSRCLSVSLSFCLFLCACAILISSENYSNGRQTTNRQDRHCRTVGQTDRQTDKQANKTHELPKLLRLPKRSPRRVGLTTKLTNIRCTVVPLTCVAHTFTDARWRP